MPEIVTIAYDSGRKRKDIRLDERAAAPLTWRATDMEAGVEIEVTVHGEMLFWRAYAFPIVSRRDVGGGEREG